MLAASRKRRPPKVELTEEQKAEIREAFELFDTEKTGRIGYVDDAWCPSYSL